MSEVTIIGVDPAKQSFQVHGARSDGSVGYRKKLTRGQLLSFLAEQPTCLARLCTKFAHVHVQKISFVAISSRASSRGKMIPPKSPTSFQCPR